MVDSTLLIGNLESKVVESVSKHEIYFSPSIVCTNIYEVNELISKRNALTVTDTDGVYHHMFHIPVVTTAFKDGASSFLSIIKNKMGVAVTNRNNWYVGTKNIIESLSKVYGITLVTSLDRQRGRPVDSNGSAKRLDAWSVLEGQIDNIVKHYLGNGLIEDKTLQIDFIYDTLGPGTVLRSGWSMVRRGYRKLVNNIDILKDQNANIIQTRDIIKDPLKHYSLINRFIISEPRFLEDLAKYIIDNFDGVDRVNIQRIELPKIYKSGTKNLAQNEHVES